MMEDIANWLSPLLNILLGGGLVAIVTLDLSRKQKAAEVERMNLENTNIALEIYKQNVVEPLQRRVEKLETAMDSMQAKLEVMERAAGEAYRCRHTEDCPVLRRLHGVEEKQEE